ncbi:protein xylosyltransferase [Paragonimus westermani]|uniref:protein xylosyltransferase n=1 Tax=Paragonimus westermani TaxID=34504 RepID=A0A5J4NZY8_9TREM|nr:protein xylosyltransferase [Paragonimus westermani]
MIKGVFAFFGFQQYSFSHDVMERFSGNLTVLVVFLLIASCCSYFLLSFNAFDLLFRPTTIPIHHLSTSVEFNSTDVCFSSHHPAWNAFQRASSSFCKSYLKKIMCSGVANQTVHINSQCPNRRNVTLPVKYLGCYRIDQEKLLPIILQEPVSMDACVQFCQLTGVRYAFTTANQVCACSRNRLSPDYRTDEYVCLRRCLLISQINRVGDQLLPNCSNPVSIHVTDTGAIAPLHLPAAPLVIYNRLPDIQSVRIVYLLVWHGRGWLHTRRVFHLLFHPRHFYYIHVDFRSDYLYQHALELAQRYPQNVHVTSNRRATEWGGTDLLWMMLSAMNELLTQLTNWQWDFLINLSAADMLIRPHAYLVAYLSTHPGKIFLGSNPNMPRFVVAQGMDRIFAYCDQHIWHLGRRPYPTGIVFDGGSDWMVLPREFVDYIVHSHDVVLTKLKQYATYSLLPVEMFFHVLAQNTRFCISVISSSLRFVHWDRPRGCECKHDTIVDWCGCSPVAFRGPQDRTQLCEVVGGCSSHPPTTKPVFFARKFDPTIDLGSINFVATSLLDADNDFATANFYLENIFSSQYDSPETPPSWSLTLPFVTEMIFTKLASASKYLLFPIRVQFEPFSLTICFTLYTIVHAGTMKQLNVFTFFNATDQIETPWLPGTDSPFRHIPPKMILQTFADFDANDTIIIPVLVEAVVQPPFVGYISSVPLSSLSHGDIVYAEAVFFYRQDCVPIYPYVFSCDYPAIHFSTVLLWCFAQVTNMFDAKEQFVRNYPRLMTLSDSLKLVLFWKGLPSAVPNSASQSTTVLLSLDSPSGQNCVTSLPTTMTKNQQTQSAFACPNCFLFVLALGQMFNNCSSIIPGLWRVHIRSASNQQLEVPFFLFPSPRSQTSSRWLTGAITLSSPWSEVHALDHCLSAVNCTKQLRLSTYPPELDCVHKPWSTFAVHPKSVLPL